jgi:hypothetical protein
MISARDPYAAVGQFGAVAHVLGCCWAASGQFAAVGLTVDDLESYAAVYGW